MESAPVKIAIIILRHHQIPSCLVGEIALNYYNVPRVLHNIEICVPDGSLLIAAAQLCSTGLFEAEELGDFNLFTEYMRDMPRLRTTGWMNPMQTIVLFPATVFGLDPIEKSIVKVVPASESQFSKQILDYMDEADIIQLPMPRLAPLLIGLAQRWLEQGDDVAMIALEQLVDGMDIDDPWCDRNLGGEAPRVRSLVTAVIGSKKSRIDDFSGNKVTCFIKDEEETRHMRQIPGFE